MRLAPGRTGAICGITYNRASAAIQSARVSMGSIPLDLSIVFPARDEAPRLPRALEQATAYCRRRGLAYEIIVVDDGSRDETKAMAQQASRLDPAVRCVVLPENRGKGAAVREAMRHVSGRWILMSDVDLSTPLTELDRLEVHREHADVIIGSRAVVGSERLIRQSSSREWMGRGFNLAVRLLGLSGCHDTQCGFKLWSKAAASAVFPHLTIERFAFDVESLWLARTFGFRILEVPVRWAHDAGSTVNVPVDGARMTFDLLRLVVRARVLQRVPSVSLTRLQTAAEDLARVGQAPRRD
ncbi:MAG: glycosyltransferase family 2 protein [Acidobacteria bacterium]|nr:glycosyltransferase family 2 protein [Acidobacteriota bacterium]